MANLSRIWLPLAVVITLLSLMIYIVAQQIYRQSANDPQIQMADDAAASLENGQPGADLLNGSRIDMARSLAPYLIIFDDGGKPLYSGVELDGQVPVPPPGVFEFTKSKKRDIITWQPRPGIRHAAVIMYFNERQSGFVLAGRSMREAENRIGKIGMGIFAGWLITLFCSLIVTFVIDIFARKFLINPN